ncbi:dihydrofolate reductase family protein [Phocaeicola coprocola DSM 17136]|uniref:dihydrofolate reductase family protein n=1 Tax=Phocaeicola coprocola TaxID=310298 RepID=UPI001D154DBB|nr:dihydrofolate reductase family protein [Phocaeicola coprocola DSM 17136]
MHAIFYFTASGRNRMTAMAKVRLLAVLTMDGCPAETTGLSGRWLGSDQYGIGALKEAATCVLTEDTSLTLLSNRTEQTDDSLNYLIEATEKTAGIINGMIRMRLVDEIILYMVPVIAGNGSRLFQSSLPESEWTCTESKRWKDNIIRITYGRKTPRQPVVVFKK